jgi:VWFA-related protein
MSATSRPVLAQGALKVRTRLLIARMAAALAVLGVGFTAGPAAHGLETIIDRINVRQTPSVKAYVTVLDSAGDTVKGLRQSNFEITDQLVDADNAEPVESPSVRSALESGESLGVVLLIDRSGSMRGEPISAARKAAAEFVTRLSLTDRAAVLSFSTETTVVANATSDTSQLQERIRGITVGGDTALYDAAKQAVEMAAAMDDVTRRTVVLLTDGKRTAGAVRSPDPVAQAAEDGNVRIFTIGLGREPEHDVLRRLARDSQGAHYEAASSSDLMAIYQKIADRLTNQYVVEFQQQAGVSFRKLNVVVQHAGQTASASMKYWPREGSDAPAEVEMDTRSPSHAEQPVAAADQASEGAANNPEDVQPTDEGEGPAEDGVREGAGALTDLFEGAPRWMIIATIAVASLAIAVLAAIVVVLVRRR